MEQVKVVFGMEYRVETSGGVLGTGVSVGWSSSSAWVKWVLVVLFQGGPPRWKQFRL